MSIFDEHLLLTIADMEIKRWETLLQKHPEKKALTYCGVRTNEKGRAKEGSLLEVDI